MPYITSIERLGLEKGRQQGLEQGLEQGRQDARNDVARKMLGRGADRDFILEITELTDQQLVALEKELRAEQESGRGER